MHIEPSTDSSHSIDKNNAVAHIHTVADEVEEASDGKKNNYVFREGFEPPTFSV